MGSRPRHLHRIALFAEISAPALAELEAGLVRRRVAPGEVLVSEGARESCAFAVLSGRLKVVSRGEDGAALALDIVGPGSLIGELALLDPGPRSASAVALDPVRVLVLHRRELLPFLRDHPDAALAVMAALVRRIRQLSADRRAQAVLPLPERLWRTLEDLAARFGHERGDGSRLIDVALSQGELGQMIGASRESVNKQLRAWRDEQRILVEQGYITLLQV